MDPTIIGKVGGLVTLQVLILSPIHIYEYIMYGDCFKYDPDCSK